MRGRRPRREIIILVGENPCIYDRGVPSALVPALHLSALPGGLPRYGYEDKVKLKTGRVKKKNFKGPSQSQNHAAQGPEKRRVCLGE